MLVIFRRHLKACPHRKEGRKYRRCRCPIHVEGRLKGQLIRRALDTRNWELAQETVRDWEAKAEIREAPVTIEEACRGFLVDAEARHLSESTIQKLKLLTKSLTVYGRRQGYRHLKQLDVEILREYRASWKLAPLTALKQLERLRAFFKFCLHNKWIAENPAIFLKPPKVQPKPTLPFSRDEMQRVLASCSQYQDEHGRTGTRHALRLEALVLLLRYSGLRISDAVTLPKSKIVDGKVFLYTAKTGVPVWCPLPPDVLEFLASVPPVSKEYFFWTGHSKPVTAIKNWRRSLTKLFKLAQILNGHAHRFRDTFAIELLLASVPIDQVSILLGHSSIKVTEKHYAPWIRARQERLEEFVQRAWMNKQPTARAK